jgi:hypothetical protein
MAGTEQWQLTEHITDLKRVCEARSTPLVMPLTPPLFALSPSRQGVCRLPDQPVLRPYRHCNSQAKPVKQGQALKPADRWGQQRLLC